MSELPALADPLQHPAARPRRPERAVLYRTVASGLDAFLDAMHDVGRSVPRFVLRELRAYLRCGLAEYGLVRLWCPTCRHEEVVAFSCKGRGFCPSCCGRRMNDTAAHLVDRVLPDEAPLRQWVLSLPYTMRYRLAFDATTTTEVLRIFVRRVFAWQRRKARALGMRDPYCGAVTVVQRFDSAAGINVHFHTLVLDGVYTLDPQGRPVFSPFAPPDAAELLHVVRGVRRAVLRLLRKKGWLDEDATYDPVADREPALAQCPPPCRTALPAARPPAPRSTAWPAAPAALFRPRPSRPRNATASTSTRGCASRPTIAKAASASAAMSCARRSATTASRRSPTAASPSS